MLKNKIILMMSVVIGLLSTGLHGYYDATELVEHCKTIGMDDRASQAFLKNPDLKMLQKLYQTAAMKNHPDTGGSHQAFVALGQAKDCLLEYANQSKRVTFYSSSSTKSSSYGSYSAGSRSGASSSTSSTYSSWKTADSDYSSSNAKSTRFKSYYADLSEFLDDLVKEADRINKSGLRTDQDWQDFHECMKKFTEYDVRSKAESAKYSSSTGSAQGKSTGATHASYGSTSTGAKANSSAGATTGSAHCGYESHYNPKGSTYASSAYSSASDVKSPYFVKSQINLSRGFLKLGIFGVGTVYGLKSLRDYLHARQQQDEKQDEKQVVNQTPVSQEQPSTPVVSAVSSKRYLKASAGLAVAVVVGVAAYKAYCYCYGKSNTSSKDGVTKLSTSQPTKIK